MALQYEARAIAATIKLFVGNPWMPILVIRKGQHGIKCIFGMKQNAFCDAYEQMSKWKKKATKLALGSLEKQILVRFLQHPDLKFGVFRINSNPEYLYLWAFLFYRIYPKMRNPTYSQWTSSLLQSVGRCQDLGMRWSAAFLWQCQFQQFGSKTDYIFFWLQPTQHCTEVNVFTISSQHECPQE